MAIMKTSQPRIHNDLLPFGPHTQLSFSHYAAIAQECITSCLRNNSIYTHTHKLRAYMQLFRYIIIMRVAQFAASVASKYVKLLVRVC